MRRITAFLILALAAGMAAMAGPGARPASAQPGGNHGTLALNLQQAVTVNIVDFAFNPGNVNITTGATVTWRNTGVAPHTATADNRAFTSSILNPGQTFAFKFDTPGAFAYHCEVHPSMTATINVQAAPQPTAAPTQPPPAATATRAATQAPAATAAPTQAATAAPTQAAAATAAPAQGGGNTVKIVDFAFEPGDITVPAGTTVTWAHDGNAPHTATSTGDLKFDSGRLAKGQTFSFKFDQPGAYNYRCEVHPGRMTGTITVQAAGGAAAQPPAGGEPRGATGLVQFGDQQGRSDSVRIDVENLPAQQGASIVAWLASTSGEFLALGELKPDAKGKASLTFNDPQRRNLLGLFERVTITAETAAAGAKPNGKELLRDEIPGPAMVHIRHLLARFEEAPNQTPLATGLLSQAALAADHANLAKLALNANDFAGVKLHLEHVVNIIEGEKGANFGDLNGDEKRDNPGDGFGLLNYAKLTSDHAQFAADAAPRDETISLHAGHVKTSTQNVTTWATQARDLALQAAKAPNIGATRAPIDQIADLLAGSLEGRDSNKDGKVDPIPGEGAARTAYNHSQLMALMEPTAAQVTGAPAPAAPAANPTTAAPASTPQTNPEQVVASESSSGTKLVLMAVIAAAVLIVVLGVAGWLVTNRKGASPATGD